MRLNRRTSPRHTGTVGLWTVDHLGQEAASGNGHRGCVHLALGETNVDREAIASSWIEAGRFRIPSSGPVL